MAPPTGNIATVTITDNIAPTAVDVQATTAGGPVSQLDPGDTITFTFSEPIDPDSIVAGWDGTGSQNVVVRVTDNGPLDDDRLEVYNAANTVRLPLGVGRHAVAGDYVRATIGFGSIYFGAIGTPSTMTISGNTVTIVLGTYSEQPRQRHRRGGNGNDGLVADSGAERLRGQPARSHLRNRVRRHRQRLLTLQRSDKLVAAALVKRSRPLPWSPGVECHGSPVGQRRRTL